MNLKLIIPSSFKGGPFSKFFVMLQNAMGYDAERLYFFSDSSKGNRFDWMFEQDAHLRYFDKTCVPVKFYGKTGIEFKDNAGNIEDSEEFSEMRKLAKTLVIKPKLISTANKFHIDDKTLGVHIRIIDYNKVHADLGVFYIEDYIRKIREVLDKEDVSNIFVSSDNFQSILILKKEFGNRIIYYDSKIRPVSNYLWQGINNPVLWEEMMIWMLILSKCRYLVCRISNGSNAAILFSDSITKIYRL